MNYAILRIEKIKSMQELNARGKHNYRERPCKHSIHNRTVEEICGGKNVSERAKEILPKKGRKNGVLALEVLLSASAEYFRPENPEEAGAYDFRQYEAFECEALAFLNEQFGEKNIISCVGHLDESVPHIHAICIPIDPRGKLNAQHWMGNKEKLRAMKDAWHEKTKKLGLQRGQDARKTQRKHFHPKSFYSMVYRLGMKFLLQLAKKNPKEEVDNEDSAREGNPRPEPKRPNPYQQ